MGAILGYELRKSLMRNKESTLPSPKIELIIAKQSIEILNPYTLFILLNLGLCFELGKVDSLFFIRDFLYYYSEVY